MANSSDSSSAVPQKHFDYLDGWRGLAIAFLLAGHFYPAPGINLGALGVNFFFVLSGWLMTRLLFVQETAIDQFYRRRISRIVPAHIVFIISIAVFWLLTDRAFSTTETFAAALFVNNYVASPPGTSVMPLGHIWSLSVEEHCYVLLSILAIWNRKYKIDPMHGLGIITLACAMCAWWYSHRFSGPKLAFDQWLHTEVAGYGIFASGFILLARLRFPSINFPPITAPLLALAGIALHWWSIPIEVQKIFGVGALAIAVNFLPNSPSALLNALSCRPLRLLGLWSFSLYIWQQPFYLWSRNGGIPAWGGLTLAVIAGLCSYYLIENPIRSYLNKNWGRRSPPH